MIRNESLTFCPGGSYEPIWCSVVTGYSQDIFHFWPHPFSQKLQRTSCKWWQFISVQRHQPGTELQPSSDLFVFKERVCERKVIGGDQLESDLERGQKIETWDNSKMRARLRQWGQWLWCGQDWGPPACRSWLERSILTWRRDDDCNREDQGSWMSDSRLMRVLSDRYNWSQSPHVWGQTPVARTKTIVRTDANNQNLIIAVFSDWQIFCVEKTYNTCLRRRKGGECFMLDRGDLKESRM